MKLHTTTPTFCISRAIVTGSTENGYDVYLIGYVNGYEKFAYLGKHVGPNAQARALDAAALYVEKDTVPYHPGYAYNIVEQFPLHGYEFLVTKKDYDQLFGISETYPDIYHNGQNTTGYFVAVNDNDGRHPVRYRRSA